MSGDGAKNEMVVKPSQRTSLAGHHSECHELRLSCIFLAFTVDMNITKKKS